jgi:drug/metabolite transporter (DMT)-like permease
LTGETIPDTAFDRSATNRALLLMTASATLFGFMAFAAKLASNRLSGPEVAMIRFGFHLMPVLLVARYRRAATHFRRWDLLLYRGFFGGLAVLLYFIAIAHINVGIATLLNYSSPIFSGIFSMIFLREHVSSRVLIPMPIALAGIVLVVHAHANPGDLLGFGRWELIGLLSAVASGAAVSAMRAARQFENSWSVYGSFCLLGLLTCLPQGISSWQTPTVAEWKWLVLMALFAIGAQLLLTFSLRWVDAVTVGVISQLAVLVSMALGATVLHESITVMAAVGTVLTIGGVVGVVYVTSVHKRARADEVVVD